MENGNGQIELFDSAAGVFANLEAVRQAEPKAQPPILEREGQISEVYLRSCSCGLAWCLKCWRKRGAKTVAGHLKQMKWQHVRMITLTVDREQFPGGQTAYKAVQRSGAISEWIKALKRHGVKINDYRWVLEWHTDGFPHWHVVIEVAEAGIAGRIGGDLIRQYWPFGKWIHESPIKSEDHWKAIYGYVGGRGYFKSNEKGHQVTLPEWALDADYTIRRTSSARGKRTVSSKLNKLNESDSRYLDFCYKRVDSTTWIDRDTGEVLNNNFKPKRERKPVNYRARLADCGSRSSVNVHLPDGSTAQFETAIPYRELKSRIGGEYEPSIGYVVGTGGTELIEEIIQNGLKLNSYRKQSDRKELVKEVLREAWFAWEVAKRENLRKMASWTD